MDGVLLLRYTRNLPEFTNTVASFLGEYTVIIEQGVDGYLIARVVELPGCFTQARTKPELLRRAKEAIEAYLEAAGQDDTDETPPAFVGVEKVLVP
jgi:predicted RNase H-like HicB family nuclease